MPCMVSPDMCMLLVFALEYSLAFRGIKLGCGTASALTTVHARGLDQGCSPTAACGLVIM